MNEKNNIIEEVSVQADADLSAQSPVKPDLLSQMQIDISVNKSSQVFVFHTKPFPDILEWAEYDAEDRRLVFITKGGFLNDFGMDVSPKVQKYLERAEFIEAFLIDGEKTLDYANVKLFVRKMLH